MSVAERRHRPLIRRALPEIHAHVAGGRPAERVIDIEYERPVGRAGRPPAQEILGAGATVGVSRHGPAYATALDLPGGLLIYAEGEPDDLTYTVRHAGKRLEVAAVDLSGTIDDILRSVDALAGRVKSLSDEALRVRHAA